MTFTAHQGIKNNKIQQTQEEFFTNDEFFKYLEIDSHHNSKNSTSSSLGATKRSVQNVVPMTCWQHLFHIIHTGSLLILDTLLSHFLSGSLVCQATYQEE